jgi:hypothetical protein
MRKLNEIARDITKDWVDGKGKVPVNALPYLQAMRYLETVEDYYILDSGRSIVNYFLSNSTSWRGEKAREIKQELRSML